MKKIELLPNFTPCCDCRKKIKILTIHFTINVYYKEYEHIKGVGNNEAEAISYLKSAFRTH